MEKIEIIGAGYIGLPLAAAFSQCAEVIVVEKNVSRLQSLIDGSFLYGEPDVDVLLKENSRRILYVDKPKECDRIIIAVQTPTKLDGTPDLSSVTGALKDVTGILKKDTLLILESTVPVGTGKRIKKMLSSLGFEGCFAYCPETILPGNVLAEIRDNARVIGSDDPVALSRSQSLYSKISLSDIDVCSFEEAELVKLLQNAARDVDLAFANQVGFIAEKEGLDPFSLISKINKHPRIKIRNPGSGVGGHCIPVDPLFLINRYGDDVSLLSAARSVNDKKPIRVAKEAERLCKARNGRTIGVFGLSYKADIGDLRNSSGLVIAKKLVEDGFDVIGCEPNSKADVIEGIPNAPIEEAIRRSDVFVLAQPHKAFKPYKKLFGDDAVVDPCGFIKGSSH